MSGDDEDLRGAFASLRNEVELRAPGFDEVLSRPPRAVSSHRLAVGIAACFVAVIALSIFLQFGYPSTPRSQRDQDLFILAWTPPTDFLLETPGREVMRSVPRIGDVPVRR